MQASTIIYSLIAGMLPSLIWLLFWTREDTNSEPRGLLVSIFIGGMVSVLFAVFAEKYIANIITDTSLRYTLWATVEEICKFAVVIFVALNSKSYDEPIDAMIYCIVAALGFAALENTFFLLEPLRGGEIAQSIITGNMRFIGATLVHIVSSATIGFSLGLTYYKGYLTKTFAVIIGLISAIIIHTAFNISITNIGGIQTLNVFAWVWGAVVILIILFEEVKMVKQKLS